MSTYQRDGLDLRYEIRGAGPPVLCVHGATGTAYDWSKVADALDDRYSFIIPDLRGHGASDYRAGEMSIEEVNADLLALISHEHLEPPHVLAFSFGAVRTPRWPRRPARARPQPGRCCCEGASQPAAP